MGIYIPHQIGGYTKEEILAEHGTMVAASEMVSLATDPDFVGVCLVDNGIFTAAAVAYDGREAERITQPDVRERRYYKVSRNALKSVGVFLP